MSYWCLVWQPVLYGGSHNNSLKMGKYIPFSAVSSLPFILSASNRLVPHIGLPVMPMQVIYEVFASILVLFQQLPVHVCNILLGILVWSRRSGNYLTIFGPFLGCVIPSSYFNLPSRTHKISTTALPRVKLKYRSKLEM